MIIQINYFQGDLSGISAKTATLTSIGNVGFAMSVLTSRKSSTRTIASASLFPNFRIVDDCVAELAVAESGLVSQMERWT